MKQPYFPFYVNDWLSSAKVILMSCEARGGYINLLCHDWMQDGLPDDDAVLSVLSGLGCHWNASALPLRECFEKCPDEKLRNPKLSSIRADNQAYSEKQRLIAQRRWNKAMPTHCDGNANPVPEGCLSLALASSLALTLSKSFAVALSYSKHKDKKPKASKSHYDEPEGSPLNPHTIIRNHYTNKLAEYKIKSPTNWGTYTKHCTRLLETYTPSQICEIIDLAFLGVETPDGFMRIRPAYTTNLIFSEKIINEYISRQALDERVKSRGG